MESSAALIQVLDTLLEEVRQAGLWPKNIRARCVHKHWNWMVAIRELPAFEPVVEMAGPVIAEQRNLYPHECATWLAWRGARRSSTQAVAEALAAVEADTLAATSTVVLSGPKVVEPIALNEQTAFMAFDKLPWSFEKVDFRPRKYDIHDVYRVVGPTAALYTKQTVSWGAAEHFPVDESMAMDFVRCLTLASRKPVIPLTSWQQHGLEVPLMKASSFPRRTLSDIIHPDSAWRVSVDEQESAVQMFNNLRSFETAEIEVLRVGLDRLGRGVELKNHVNSAIDLGVGAEALMAKGESKRQQVAQKTAWILSPVDAGRRKEIVRTMREFYDLRSASVHTGRASAPRTGQIVKNLLESASRHLIDAVQAIMVRGSFPGWVVTDEKGRRTWSPADA